MEGTKDEFKQGLDALKYDLHFIKGGILNEITLLHTLSSYTEEEYKDNKIVESHPYMGKIQSQLEINRFASLTIDHSSLQNPHFHGFNLGPNWNYLFTRSR